MDYWAIQEYSAEFRTATLESQKDQIIRSAVIMDYALIDEPLNIQICKYFSVLRKVIGKQKDSKYLMIIYWEACTYCKS